ncbi:MAG: hypothetical protein RLZZ58_1437, partial [Pseudomonadota bacterium]
MADAKIYAGPAVRRLRRQRALTQVAMAEALGISPSYLNLVERNQRPLTAALLIKLGRSFDVDPMSFAGDAVGGGIDAMRRRLADPLFAGMEIDRAEVDEWLASAPSTAAAFIRLFDQMAAQGAQGTLDDASGEVLAVRLARQEIERWRNHFPDLDDQAEQLADTLRLTGGDLYGAIAERLRVSHQIMIRILPADVMPDRLRRLDLHARQLQLSEMLKPASRTFQAATLLAQIEARAEIDALAT